MIALALALLVAGAAPLPLDVMTFNVRGDFDAGEATDKPEAWISTSGAHRRDRVLRLVVDADPDLLGVQEAYANQTRELADALPDHDLYAVGRDDGHSAGEHCAVYYRRDRFQRTGAGTFWLSHAPETPSVFPGAACKRIASWVGLSDRLDAGRELLIVNTHWDHESAEARAHSAAQIRDWLAEHARGRATIVLGDFNADERSAPLLTLLEANGAAAPALVDGFRRLRPRPNGRERTFHGFAGGVEGRRIDFILHTPDLRATRAEIIRTAYDGVLPSDHYPVTAELARRP